jgi:hypothetical protein
MLGRGRPIRPRHRQCGSHGGAFRTDRRWRRGPLRGELSWSLPAGEPNGGAAEPSSARRHGVIGWPPRCRRRPGVAYARPSRVDQKTRCDRRDVAGCDRRHLPVAIEWQEEHTLRADRPRLPRDIVHEGWVWNGTKRDAGAGEEIVHPERGSGKPTLVRPRSPAAKRGDIDHILHTMTLQRLGRWSCEVDICLVDRLGGRVGRHRSEQRIRTVKSPVDDLGIAMREYTST